MIVPCGHMLISGIRWCPVDDECRRVLVGDAFGRLAMLAFDDVKMCLTLIPLGEVGSFVASCI